MGEIRGQITKETATKGQGERGRASWVYTTEGMRERRERREI